VHLELNYRNWYQYYKKPTIESLFASLYNYAKSIHQTPGDYNQNLSNKVILDSIFRDITNKIEADVAVIGEAFYVRTIYLLKGILDGMEQEKLKKICDEYDKHHSLQPVNSNRISRPTVIPLSPDEEATIRAKTQLQTNAAFLANLRTCLA